MNPADTDKHDGKLEVSWDYVCLPTEYRNAPHSSTDVVDPQTPEIADASMSSPDVADWRRRQELISASLHSSGSVFIFSAATPPLSASDTAPQSHLRLPIGGLYVRVVRVEETRAHLDDDAALAKLLASLPLPPLVGPLLYKSFFGRKWDCATQCDHWIASDGKAVVSLKIFGASASIVARMRLRFDGLRVVSPELQPCLKVLHDLLEGIAREDDLVARIPRDARQLSCGSQS